MKRLLVLLALGVALLRPCHADVAVVVGADYDGNAHLEGPANDATDMKAALEALQFKVPYFLKGFDATYQHIVDALQAVITQTHIGKDEKFVFYFAGHGLPSPAAIVPSDFPDTRKLIEMKKLYELVNDIRAHCKSATVILDSCFSGGMAKEAAIDSKEFGVVRSRCYPSDDLPSDTGSKSGRNINLKDPQEQVAPDYSAPGNKPICYVMAASANQKANECLFSDRKSHGVFTVFLKGELAKVSSADIDWDQIGRKVQAEMDGAFTQIEHATNENFIQDLSITKEYKPFKPFNPLTLDPKHTVPDTALQMIQQANIDANMVSLVVPGDRRDYVLGEPVKLSVKVGHAGYLVILSDQSAVTLYSPRSGNVDDAKVNPGEVPLFADDKSFGIFTEDGDQEVKAILFADRDSAARFLSVMPKSPKTATNMSALDAAKLPPPAGAGAGAARYWTSTADFQAHSQLFGGYEVVDTKGLLAALRQDAYSDLQGAMANTKLVNFDAVSHWVDQPDGFGPARVALTMGLNLVIPSSKDWTDKSWAAKCPEPLKSKLAAGQALTNDEGGLLLFTLFPMFIHPVMKATPPSAVPPAGGR